MVFGDLKCNDFEKNGKLKKNTRDTGRVSLRHPAGQTGVYRPVSQGFPVIYHRKTDRKGLLFPGHRPGVPGTPGHPGGFQIYHVIFSYVPFVLLGSVSLALVNLRTEKKKQPKDN